ncbi:MAG TPA: hypothetical protein VMT16_13270, partial [Thermoanaerobaculia bacterium]|nr:hypothetical protein [Thermoanaerobaculia bacterium]
FATLWLGIVTGLVPVELLVPPGVARVELLLDGEPVAELTGPPWSVACDVGPELAPHELVAVAFDERGRELGRARQRLNLPRPRAEIEVSLAARDDGTRLVRVSWAAAGGEPPSALRATLDGEAVEVAGPSFPLPPVDSTVPHLLRVEADFPGSFTATREVVFGGAVGDVIDRDLTALPIVVAGREPPPSSVVLATGGERLPASTVEKGMADLVVVVDPRARPALADLVAAASRQRPLPGGRQPVDLRYLAPLAEDHRLRLLSPVPEVRRGEEGRLSLFPPSPDLSPRQAGLLWHLNTGPSSAAAAPPRLADAVVVAGLMAGERTARRAVLLILGPETSDASEHAAAAARRYLQRLRVPLSVWQVGRRDGVAEEPWGAVRQIGGVAAFEAATRRLRRELDRQRIVWVEGFHLPQQLTLDTAAEGVRIAGAETEPAEGPVAASPMVNGRDAPQPGSPVATRSLGPFRLRTDLDDEETLAHLDAVAAALPAAWSGRFGQRLGSEPSGEVLLFARDGDFRGFLGGAADASVAGNAVGDQVALAAAGRPRDELVAVLVHELSHLLARQAFGPALPPWLEEGLAEELAMSRLDRKGRLQPGTLRGVARSRRLGTVSDRETAHYEVTIDGALAAVQALLAAQRRGAAPALGELLELPADVFVLAQGRRERYTASAMFVRFLLDGERGRLRAPFHGFLAAVAAGGSADGAALEAALGTPLPELARRFQGWLSLQAGIQRGDRNGPP